jgi:hypothetical protein
MPTYRLLEFDRSGFHAEFHRNQRETGRLRGYRDPETWRPEHGDYPDHTPVVDIRAVVEARPSLAIASPMLKTYLRRGEVERFGEILASDTNGTASMMLEALAGGNDAQRGMAALATIAASDQEFGGLDNIGVDDYVEWWRARGARIGEIIDGAIVWNS